VYNDAAIANRVREAILLNSRVSAQDITITCRDRVVTLTGEVDTLEQAEEAERTAAEVDGVGRVVNELFVRAIRWPSPEREQLPWYRGR